MPATGPIPAEVARCFDGQAGQVRPRHRLDRPVHDRGRRQGRRLLVRDAQADERLRRPVSTLTLVRNPDYDPKTDSPAARQNLPGRVRVHRRCERRPTSSTASSAGDLDDEAAPSLPPQALERYSQDPAKRKYLHLNSGDGTYYLTMNLTQPPFDDVHVRRAMNWIIDKAALRQAWGGPTHRQDREPHRPRLDLRQPARRATPRTGRPATTAASPRRRRR